ncbi:AmmeMemoRadiSam system radical SAM enzyme, partial [Candidatus Woesearchaeota archaeon]|nr:AmmeMemoRadiSam system radical SAM enzyme [Candidatus Woesearchaeota archaeon]
CTLCPHNCPIPEAGLGICSVRKNVKGKLYSLVYGKPIASHVDPIEKKPLFHFKPGSKIYSFATAGCNFRCEFCQNWEISQISKGEQGEIIGEKKSPSQIVKEAIATGCESIAMTYVEPTIFFEYGLDTCKEAKKNGLYTVFVSNGYINKEPIDMIQPYLDGINIDLKSFSEEFYKKRCGARLQPVLDSIKYYHKKGVWVEVTTLIIPGENDSSAELKKAAEFIASVDKNMPWHISRFHPDYKMTDKQRTPLETLHKAYNIGKKAGLNYVYVGNVSGDKYENTYCPKCDKLLVERCGFEIVQNNLKENKCGFCGEEIAGVF